MMPGDTASSKVAEFRAGWRVVLASAFGAGAGAIPLAFYSFGAFIDPLSRAFGWTRAEITAAPLFLTLGGLLAGVLAGALADRFGARRVVLISQVMLVFAFASLSLLPPSLPAFYAAYAMIAVLGAGTMTMTWARAITGWFVSARGIALGLSLIGTGLIGAILPSYITYIVEAYSWRAAYLGLAALPLVLGLPLSLLFFREPPGDENRQRAAVEEVTAADGSFTFAEALRTRCFWQMTFTFTVVALAISSVNVHCVPMLTDRGIDPAKAAGMAGLIGISVTLGRLVSGYALDIFRGPTVAFVMFALPALSCLLLTVSGTDLLLTGIAIVLVGLAAGAEHDLAAYFCARFFGRRHYGKVYGLLYTLYGVGSGLGPLLTGRAVDTAANYNGALYVGAALFGLSALMIFTLNPPAPVMKRDA